VAHKPSFLCPLSVSPELEKLCNCPKVIQLQMNYSITLAQIFRQIRDHEHPQLFTAGPWLMELIAHFCYRKSFILAFFGKKANYSMLRTSNDKIEDSSWPNKKKR
jgi:hypothetical protein